MKSITTDQLQKALKIYFEEMIVQPDNFSETTTSPSNDAEAATIHLIDIIRENNL